MELTEGTVGGLLPIVNKTSNGLVDKDNGFYKQPDYNGNLDDAANGYIRHLGGIENTHAPKNDFVGIVYTLVVHNTIKVQHASCIRDNSVYERIYWEEWRPWVKLS